MGQRWFLTLEIVIPVLEHVAQCPSLVLRERERELRLKEGASGGSLESLRRVSEWIPPSERRVERMEGGEECCRGQAWLGTRCPPSGGGMSRWGWEEGKRHGKGGFSAVAMSVVAAVLVLFNTPMNYCTECTRCKSHRGHLRLAWHKCKACLSGEEIWNAPLGLIRERQGVPSDQTSLTEITQAPVPHPHYITLRAWIWNASLHRRSHHPPPPSGSHKWLDCRGKCISGLVLPPTQPACLLSVHIYI